MNTRLVNTAADVISRAMQQGRTLPAALAVALDSAQLLQSPETVKQLAEYERLNPQQCPIGQHADWLVDSEYAHACPWCRVSELEADRKANDREYEAATARVAELETELRTTNESLSEAAEALRRQRDRITALERRIAAEECRCPEPAPLCEGCRCQCHAAEQRPADEDPIAYTLTVDSYALRSCCAGPVCTCTPSSPQDDEYLPPHKDAKGADQ